MNLNELDMIVSVSRKTDIPAFYADWFFNRLEAGFVLYKNPFNANQVHRVELTPENVDAFVFWTRNPQPFISRLDLLEPYIYYFQYTITGYPRYLEKSTPNPYKAIETFKNLSRIIGRERVIWRYDPILLSNTLTIQEHKRLFSKIADLLNGYTDKVVISFADFYKKTERNLKSVQIPIKSENTISKFEFFNILDKEFEDNLKELVLFMKNVAKENGMTIETCSEEIDLKIRYGIEITHGKCIDNELLEKIAHKKGFPSKKDKGQRQACGCVESRDIGIYDTCVHGCQYCYATTQHDKATENKKKHNPESPFLLGDFPTSFTDEQRAEKLKPPSLKTSKLSANEQPSIFDLLDM
jgi:protein of hypothetical function DUF1848